MMIYGLNFNGSNIPALLALRIAKEKSFAFRAWCSGCSVECHPTPSTKLRLQGICNTSEELKAMVCQADNGHRHVAFTDARTIQGESWYAVYCG